MNWMESTANKTLLVFENSSQFYIHMCLKMVYSKLDSNYGELWLATVGEHAFLTQQPSVQFLYNRVWKGQKKESIGYNKLIRHSNISVAISSWTV